MNPTATVYILSILALLFFAYVRNRVAARNDMRRERLEQKQEKIQEILGLGEKWKKEQEKRNRVTE